MSTRNEIGCLATGSTTVADSQNPAGSRLRSRDDVRSISASVTLRSRARSARPRRVSDAGGLVVRLALTSVTHPGRNNAPLSATALGPVGVDHSERHPFGTPDGDNPTLPVVSARVLALQRRAVEDLRRELEVKPPLTQISIALSSVPPKRTW